MSYTKATNFAVKDALPTGDPDKIVRGTEIDAEFTAIQTATGLYAPKANPTFTGNISVAGASITSDVAIADKIVHAGDTNTAVRFPAADTVSIETGGAERFRVTSLGAVGIGTTTPEDIAKVVIEGDINNLQLALSTASGDNLGLLMNDQGGYIGTSPGSTVDALRLGTGYTERMRITATGDVGIGTLTPTAKLHVAGTGLFSTSVSTPIVTNEGALSLRGTGASGAVSISTNGISRVNVDSSGRVRVGFTGSPNDDVHVFNTGVAGISVQTAAASNRTVRLGSGDNSIDGFVGATSNHGFSVVTNNERRVDVSNAGLLRFTAYGAGTLSTDSSGNITASDGTLKTKTRGLQHALALVNALSPTYYRWNDETPFNSDDEELGFIAQEVADVIPEAAPVPSEGKMHNYHDRAIIAVLVKAVQELSARVEELESNL